MQIHRTHVALPGYAAQVSQATWLWMLLATLILVTGFWGWTSGLSGPFQFDDRVTPLGDPASQSLAAWQQYLPLTLRPVTKLSYALEAEAGIATEPAPRRIVSILLHAVAAGALFLLIAQLMPGATLLLPAFLAAIWFVHPAHATAF